MELKPGYKQTEVGMIPKDWEVDKIKHLSQITTGSRNTQDRIENGAYPFFVRSQKVEKINSFSFDGEAVLTAGDGVGTGKVFHYISGKFDFHQRVYKISNFSPTLDGYYFYLYFSSHFYNRISQMTAKSSVDSVRMEMIADMQIPIPPTKTEQTAIANALSDADALIQSLTRLIAKKRQIKQGAMQTLLNPYENGRLKAGWVAKKLGDAAPLQRGFDLPNSQLRHGQYPVVYSNGVLNYHSRKQVSGPGVITGRSGTLGAVHYVEMDYWPHNTTLWVTNFFGNDPRFIYYLFKRIGFSRFGTGSGVPTLNRNDAHSFVIGIPKQITEQTRIATILSDMDTEIAVLEIKLAKYRHIKQGMMQNLLTGRIRLVKPGSNTGAVA